MNDSEYTATEQLRDSRRRTETEITSLIQNAFWRIQKYDRQIQSFNARISELEKQLADTVKERVLMEALLNEYQRALENIHPDTP